MKKGIIFDMDGTLWDSAANVAESWNLAIKQNGSVDKKLTEQDIQGVMGKTMDVIADILFPELEKEARMKLLDQCCSMENDYLREHGGVLYPLGKMVTFAFEGITSLSVKPIRMITIGGLLICLISLIMLIKSFVDYFNGNVVPGWASIMVSIWVLGGLQIFAIGIIGEYIGKTYLETKKRPKYIIESVILDDKDISIDRNL